MNNDSRMLNGELQRATLARNIGAMREDLCEEQDRCMWLRDRNQAILQEINNRKASVFGLEQISGEINHVQETKAANITEVRCRQEALDSRRLELEIRIAETIQHKDKIHHDATNLQRHLDAVHHDLIFAKESEQRIIDLKRLQGELQLQKESLHIRLVHHKEQLTNALREREANVNFFVHAGMRLRRNFC